MPEQGGPHGLVAGWGARGAEALRVRGAGLNGAGAVLCVRPAGRAAAVAVRGAAGAAVWAGQHGGAEQRGRAGLRRRVHPEQAAPQGACGPARAHPRPPTPAHAPLLSLQGKLEYLVKWRGWSSK